MILSITFASQIQPIQSAEQFLPSDHPIQEWVNIVQNEFPTAADEQGIDHQRPPPTTRRPPCTTRRLPPVAHQPPPTAHQPPFATHRLPHNEGTMIYLTWGIEGVDRSSLDALGGQMFATKDDAIGEAVYDKKFELNPTCQEYIKKSGGHMYT